MKNITYLFGAGASKDAVPIVREIPKVLKKFIEEFKKEAYQLPDKLFESEYQIKSNTTKRKFQQELISDLEWLLKASDCHASIDTLAKKNYLREKEGESDLRKLKIALSAYLVFKQAMKVADGRYDGFFASISERSKNNTGRLDLSSKIKIISWNYDYQFEKAFSEYSGEKGITENWTQLNVIAKHSHSIEKLDRFSIYKINGTAGFIGSSNVDSVDPLISDVTSNFDIDLITQVVGKYASLKENLNKFYPTLSFAWENEFTKESNIIEKALEGTKNTDVLIVIGYSFPFFNREIDRKIIKAMTNLEKVYFQAPDAHNLKERFLAIRDNISDDKLITRFDIEQFLLPNEL